MERWLRARIAEAMRAAAEFAIVAALLMSIGVGAALISQGQPEKDLFLRPPEPVGGGCGAHLLRATGTLSWLTLEGGMWEFDAAGGLYDLGGVEELLPAERQAWLQAHPGLGIPVSVTGIAEPCQPTFHMRGIPVRAIALEV